MILTDSPDGNPTTPEGYTEPPTRSRHEGVPPLEFPDLNGTRGPAAPVRHRVGGGRSASREAHDAPPAPTVIPRRSAFLFTGVRSIRASGQPSGLPQYSLVATEPFGIQAPLGDRLSHGAARFAPVLAVRVPACGRRVNDVAEHVVDRLPVNSGGQSPHSRGVDEGDSPSGEKLAARRRVTPLGVGGADLPRRVVHAEDRVEQSRLPGPRPPDEDGGRPLREQGPQALGGRRVRRGDTDGGVNPGPHARQGLLDNPRSDQIGLREDEPRLGPRRTSISRRTSPHARRRESGPWVRR